MRHFRSTVSALVPVGAALFAAVALPAHAAPPAAAPTLERLLESDAAVIRIAGAEIDAQALRTVYRSRAFQPIWAAPRRDQLISTLTEAAKEGLEPAAYNITAIKGRSGEAEADLLLTDAVIRYAQHLRSGRTDPVEAGQDWQHPRHEFDAAAFIGRMAGGDAAMLDELAPPYAAYALLRDALARYRELRKAGGWNQVPLGPTIKPGNEDERIPAIRRRLAVTGEYGGSDMEAIAYDAELEEAVKKFQSRHGLDADGAIGRGTLNAMNVPVEARIAQIIQNMERWRWLPRKLEKSHIAVNIAGQMLELVDDGKVTMASRVIVGKPTQKTVQFRAHVSSVTLNPVWNVPYSIASKEILPELKKNPGYLIANRLRIVGAPEGSPEQEGIGIDWKRYNSFPFQLRQMSGPDNSLGQVKFNMPNGNDIYLHDTPSKKLFDRARRALSHGCVRVQDPLRLASLVIKRPDLTPEKLQEMVDTGNTETIRLAKPLPIYLFYFTAWVDADGVVNFREDIYGYDKALAAAMNQRKQQKSALLAKNS